MFLLCLTDAVPDTSQSDTLYSSQLHTTHTLTLQQDTTLPLIADSPPVSPVSGSDSGTSSSVRLSTSTSYARRRGRGRGRGEGEVGAQHGRGVEVVVEGGVEPEVTIKDHRVQLDLILMIGLGAHQRVWML